MGVAVLSPQDCLQNPLASRQGLLSPPPKTKPSRSNYSSYKGNRTQQQQNNNRRKRSPNRSSPPRAAVDASPKVVKNNLVMGQVKILKRGEELSKVEDVIKPSKAEKTPDLDLGSTNRLGPDPELVPTQIRLTEPATAPAANGFYAGSAFITSPPPSSLPLPAFFMRKSGVAGFGEVKNEDEATNNLCRMLGLNL